MRDLRITVDFSDVSFWCPGGCLLIPEAKVRIKEDGIGGFAADLGGVISEPVIQPNSEGGYYSVSVIFDRYHILPDEGDFQELAKAYVEDEMIVNFAEQLGGKVVNLEHVTLEAPTTKDGKPLKLHD